MRFQTRIYLSQAHAHIITLGFDIAYALIDVNKTHDGKFELEVQKIDFCDIHMNMDGQIAV